MPTGRWPRWRRRLRRVLVWLLAALLGVVAIVALVLFTPGLRTAALKRALPLVDNVLPGSFSAQDLQWPHLGELHLRDLVWYADPQSATADTLAWIQQLDLKVDLRALRDKDVVVEKAVLQLGQGDVPAILKHLADMVASVEQDSLAAESAADDEAPAFPRPGGFPLVPSLAVLELDLTVADIRLQPDLMLHRLTGAVRVENRPDRETAALLEHLDLLLTREGETLQTVSASHIGLGLRAEPDLRKVYLDSLHVYVDVAGSSLIHDGWREAGGLHLDLKGEGQRGRTGLDPETIDIALRGSAILPGLAHVKPLLPPQVPVDEYPGPLLLDFEIFAAVSGQDTTAAVRLDLGRTAWLDRGLIVGALDGGTARLDTLDLQLPGLAVEVAGAIDQERFDAVFALDLQDPTLIDMFIEKDLSTADIALNFAGQTEGDFGSSSANSAHFSISGGGQGRLPELQELQDLLGVEIDVSEFSGPLLLDFDLSAALAASDTTAAVRLDLGRTAWLDRGLIVGALDGGAARLDTLDLQLPGLAVDAAGEIDKERFDATFEVDLQDPTLIDMFIEKDLSEADIALNFAGQAEGGFGNTATNPAHYTVSIEGRGRLPELKQLQDLMGVEVDADDFPGPLLMDFDLSAALSDSDTTAAVRLDLAPTAWVERGVLTGGLSGRTAWLDTLDFDLLGMAIRASGTIEPDHVAAEFDLDLREATLVRLFGGDPFAGAEMKLQVAGRADGPIKAPALDVTASGGIALVDLMVPEFSATFQLEPGEGQAHLSLPRGVRTPVARLDSLTADWQMATSGSDTLLHEIFLRAAGRELNLNLEATAAMADSLTRVLVDSLSFTVLERNMVLQKTLLVTLGPDSNSVEVRGLDLQGDMGQVKIDGSSTRAGINLDALVDLRVPQEVLELLLPSPFWSTRGGLGLDVQARIEMGGDLSKPRFDGETDIELMPGDESERLGVRGDFFLESGDEAGLGAHLALTWADSTMLQAQVNWPGQADLSQGTWLPDPRRSPSLEIPEQAFPLQRFNSILPEEIRLLGDLSLGARIDRNSAEDIAAAAADSSAGKKRSRLAELSVDGHAATKGLKINLPNRSRLELTTDVSLSGTVDDPKLAGKITIKSGFFRIPPVQQSLLPKEGEAMLWNLAGVADSLGVAMADSVAALADSLIAVVDSLAEDRRTVAKADTAGVAPNDQAEWLADVKRRHATAKKADAGFLPDLDLEVVIPSNLFIRGYGLDVELEGKLKVGRAYDRDEVAVPVLKGELRVHTGTFKFMNRMFTFDRAKIDFTGVAPADPVLNVEMQTTVDQIVIRLVVSGRASDPVIELTSVPDLNEADIMGVLLFGRSASDLDSDQRGRVAEEKSAADQLQENLAGLALAFGTTGLQQNVSNTLGVDMVEVGSDSAGGSTLMVGKYINTNILVKYNRSLEKSGTYYMTLDYTLSKFFKLVTTYGQGDEASGLEVRWQRTY